MYGTSTPYWFIVIIIIIIIIIIAIIIIIIIVLYYLLAEHKNRYMAVVQYIVITLHTRVQLLSGLLRTNRRKKFEYK